MQTSTVLVLIYLHLLQEHIADQQKDRAHRPDLLLATLEPDAINCEITCAPTTFANIVADSL